MSLVTLFAGHAAHTLSSSVQKEVTERTQSFGYRRTASKGERERETDRESPVMQL